MFIFSKHCLSNFITYTGNGSTDKRNGQIPIYLKAMAKSILEQYKNKPAVSAANGKAWRKWLEKNHTTADGVWLIFFKKHTGIPSLNWSEAVDEALCYGWIDSVANTRDADSYYQYFSPRKPKSKWSAINKAKVEQLLLNNKMTPAGMAMVNLAKQTGTWDALNEVEAGTIPDDLKKAFQKNKKALHYWDAFPKSAKRAILEWISHAKKEETRAKRIAETIRLAAQNIRANQPVQPKR